MKHDQRHKNSRWNSPPDAQNSKTDCWGALLEQGPKPASKTWQHLNNARAWIETPVENETLSSGRSSKIISRAGERAARADQDTQRR
jgi:hypothetical protein